jgi:hypothetical protein
VRDGTAGGELARTPSAAPEPTHPMGWFARENSPLALASDADGAEAASGGRPRHLLERILQWGFRGHQIALAPA